jgi:hypothetical protein
MPQLSVTTRLWRALVDREGLIATLPIAIYITFLPAMASAIIKTAFSR